MRWAHQVIGFSSLSAALLAVSVAVAAAQPAAQPAASPVAPADPAKPTDGTGQDAQLAEDPPNDIEGTSESPDAPVTGEAPIVATIKAAPQTGYPIEEVARPITLPQGMSEVALELRATLSPFVSNATLRARYGITRQWQIGLRYNGGGFYKDPITSKSGYNVGKAAGLEVTYLVNAWIGASIGVPIYLDPVASSISLGAPIRFRFGPKVTVGGLGDLLDIRISKFVPSFYSEYANEGLANAFRTNTTTDTGNLRFAGYGIYQQKPNLALYGRIGVTARDFSSLDLLYLL
nr:hypothetical protein [Kofleriaceae bacterium]